MIFWIACVLFWKVDDSLFISDCATRPLLGAQPGLENIFPKMMQNLLLLKGDLKN